MDDFISVEILVPLGSFIMIVLLVAIPFYFKHRNRRVVFDTLVATVEKTGTVDPHLVDAITQDNVGPNADLRRGILLLAIAGGLASLATFSDIPDDAPLMAIAAFPGLIGLAYVIFHFFIPREPTV